MGGVPVVAAALAAAAVVAAAAVAAASFCLCFKHGRSNLFLHPFPVGFALPVFRLSSARSRVCGLQGFKLGGSDFACGNSFRVVLLGAMTTIHTAAFLGGIAA